MDANIPRPLKTAAVIQTVSGVVNLCFASWMTWFAVSCVCGMLTLPFGSLGGVCGLSSLLLVPLGMVEIGAGIYGLMNPREAAGVMKVVAYLEIAALLIGGLTGTIAGAVVLRMLNDDEVVVFLEG